MVSPRVALAVALTVLVFETAMAGERELRRELEEAAEAHEREEALLKSNEVHELLPPVDEATCARAAERPDRYPEIVRACRAALGDKAGAAPGTAAEGDVAVSEGASGMVSGNREGDAKAGGTRKQSGGGTGQGTPDDGAPADPRSEAVASSTGGRTTPRDSSRDQRPHSGGSPGRRQGPANGDYVPLSGQARAAQQVQFGGLETQDPGQDEFGIPIGTEFCVHLRQTASNVQPGYITLVVCDTVVGEKRDLPAGSLLFAEPRAVKGSERLYLRVTKGRTPSNFEFSLNGIVFDAEHVAGLDATVISDGQMVARAGKEGATQLAQSLASQLSGSVATDATRAISEQIIEESSEKADGSLGQPQFIVSASPQRGVLAVQESF